MEHYSLLRQFADSWFLLVMFAIFAGIVVWVIFGKSKGYRDSANIVFRHEDRPAGDGAADGKENGR